MYSMFANVRYAVRRLSRAPLFTLFSITAIGLGIGATTAVEAAIKALMSPPAIVGIDRVINIYHSKPPGSGPMIWMSWPDFEDLRASQNHLTKLTASAISMNAISGRGPTERILVEMVGGDYFALVGTTPNLGRLLQPDDDRAEAANVAVISHSFWESRFGGDPAIVGSTIHIGSELFEVIGIAQPEFRGLVAPGVLPTPVWIPLNAGFKMHPGLAKAQHERESRQFSVRGRLKPDSTLEQVRAEIAAIGKRLDTAVPIGQTRKSTRSASFGVSRNWYVQRADKVRFNEQSDFFVVPIANVALIVILTVLAVACSNLANMSLARSSQAQHETAVRLAIGASRWQLIREQLIEGCFVAIPGGIIGLMVAQVLIVVLNTPVRMGGEVVQLAPKLNGFAVLIAAGATMLTLLIFSVIPAMRLTRRSLTGALRVDGATTSIRWHHSRSIIAAQVMVSTILVSVAFLCGYQVLTLSTADYGLDLARIAGSQIDFKLSRYDEHRTREKLEEVVQQLRARPGVEQVAIASSLPLSARTRGIHIARPGQTLGNEAPFARLIVGTPAMTNVFGLAILRGRAFDRRDDQGSAPVGMISETVARNLFGNVDAVGQVVKMQRERMPDEDTEPPLTITVVGVFANPNARVLGLRDPGYVLRPWTQDYDSTAGIVLRTAGDPSPLVTELRNVIHRTDPNALILDVGTGEALVGADGVTPRIIGAIAGLLGATGLVLAISGLYGVLSYIVNMRSREIGIRIALGARRGTVIRMILSEGLRPVASGLAGGLLIGAASAMLIGRAATSLFPTVNPWVLAVVPIFFLATGSLACYLPARRAARVDPSRALHGF